MRKSEGGDLLERIAEDIIRYEIIPFKDTYINKACVLSMRVLYVLNIEPGKPGSK